MKLTIKFCLNLATFSIIMFSKCFQATGVASNETILVNQTLIAEIRQKIGGSPWICSCDAPVAGGSCCDNCFEGGLGLPMPQIYNGLTCTQCQPYMNTGLTICSYYPGECASPRYLVNLHRFSSPIGDHWYSTNQNINANTVYVYENVAGLLFSSASWSGGVGGVDGSGWTLSFLQFKWCGWKSTHCQWNVPNHGGRCYLQAADSLGFLYPVYRFVNQGSGIYLLTLTAEFKIATFS